MARNPQHASGGADLGVAKASPTKAFFVRMLTRDIELEDAILDLLDNCVDGAARTIAGKPGKQRPYDTFSARVVLGPDEFVIEDNCGGIPLDTAKHYAFAMGKPPAAAEAQSVPTVGMYGIGMKRAIFKLGRDAEVKSHHDTAFLARFTPEWIATDDWDDLPLKPLPASDLPTKGTRIVVKQLNEDVKAAFADAAWRDNFRKIIAQHYSLIIEKGFQATVGTSSEFGGGLDPVSREEFRLLQSSEAASDAIRPFVYAGKVGAVEVEIYAGLYRKLLEESELESEEETRGTSDDAGWTVACNDRVVIWKDKTRLTGWGEASVPNYHGQFIAITGIVMLRSTDPRQLPLTTTKRGIDASAEVYSIVKDLMRTATKQLTSFTNKWKRFPEKLEKIYQSTQYADLDALRQLPTKLQLEAVRGKDGLKKFEPKYPAPEQERDSARISFVALKDDIALVGKHYFGDDVPKPGDVGEAAFKDAIETASSGSSKGRKK